MIICVLGMHKSGTTLVAETLHHSGVHMAEVPAGLGYDQSNKFERHEAQRLNRAVLGPVLVPTVRGFRLRNAGLDRAGYEINLDSIAWVRRRRLSRVLADASSRPIEELAARVGADHTDWGFKDPRTCLTYSWWRRSLPEHRVVAIYRPFDEVLLRYRVAWTRPIRLLRVARSWIVHNEMLAEHLEALDDFVLIRYDALMGDDDEFARLRRYVGIDLDDRRRPELYRARSASTATRRRLWLPSTIRARAERIEARLDRRRQP